MVPANAFKKILLVGARIWAEGSAGVATTFVFEEPQPKAKQTIKMSTIITLFPTLAKRRVSTARLQSSKIPCPPPKSKPRFATK